MADQGKGLKLKRMREDLTPNHRRKIRDNNCPVCPVKECIGADKVPITKHGTCMVWHSSHARWVEEGLLNK